MAHAMRRSFCSAALAWTACLPGMGLPCERGTGLMHFPFTLTEWMGALRRDIVPLGRSKANFNYNLDEKRVLNFENVVNDDDNIKQDISIDVYGRAEKTDEEAAADAAAEPAKVGAVLTGPPARLQLSLLFVVLGLRRLTRRRRPPPRRSRQRWGLLLSACSCPCFTLFLGLLVGAY